MSVIPDELLFVQLELFSLMSLSNSGVCVAGDFVGWGFIAILNVEVAHASQLIRYCHLCVYTVFIFHVVVAVVFVLPLSATMCS